MIRDLYRLLVQLLIVRICQEAADERARLMRTDLGYDDCPVCLANRRP